MIAGAFWYLMGFVTLTGLTNTFALLHARVGTVTAVVIDGVAVIVVYAAVLWLVRMWKATKVIQHPPKKLRKVQVYFEDSGEAATYELKVRIAVANETGHAIDIRKVVWIANGGEVGLELRPRLKMQIEKFKGGYCSNQWVTEEFYDLHVPADFTFRTWIGLHQQLSERDFGRVQENEQFGTLSLTIDGYDGDLQIPV